jgi:hypothetical protein
MGISLMCSSSEEKGSGEQIDASAFIYACSELVLWQKNGDGTELAAQAHSCALTSLISWGACLP